MHQYKNHKECWWILRVRTQEKVLQVQWDCVEYTKGFFSLPFFLVFEWRLIRINNVQSGMKIGCKLHKKKELWTFWVIWMLYWIFPMIANHGLCVWCILITMDILEYQWTHSDQYVQQWISWAKCIFEGNRLKYIF